MICMYDGSVYNFTQKELETLKREDLFLYFKEEHEGDIFAMYDSDNHYVGAITYHSLISSQDLPGAVLKEKLILEDGFWEKAYGLLAGQNYKVLPVFNQDMEMLYLARFESRLQPVWEKFDVLMSLGMQAGLWASSQHSGKHFHITGCNMCLYYFRQWMLSQGADVSVSGEQWSLFDIQEEDACGSEVILIDEDCGEIEYLYDEFMSGMTKELEDLEKVLDKGFVGDIEAEDKIMFWMPSVSGIFASYNIFLLILKYLKSGKTCLIIMPTKEDLIHRGAHWLKVAVQFMKDVQEAGGNICLRNELGKICQGNYFASYIVTPIDALQIPALIRKKINLIIGVQSIAFFTHYYWKSDTYCTFEGEFTEEARNATDYYVASDFIADWICQQDPRWSDKMLRLGYPKQDLLYNYMHGEKDIPKDWLEKTEGKKVFLFTELKESWLGRLLKEDNQVIILRPHPDWLNIYGEVLKKLVELSKGKLILDDRASYNASFYLADAMITEPLCSIGVVYLSTGKPMLLRNDVVDESNVKIDFRKEDWYQAAYIGESDDDVFEFMDMVRKGEDVKKQELEEYRSRMVKDFDGKVCERIYNYFEELYKK